MQSTMAVNQVRGTAANAVLGNRIDKGLFYCRMIGQAQVIVTAERQQLFAVDVGLDALRGIYDSALTIQPVGAALRQFSV